MVVDVDSLLKDAVTLDALREKFIEESSNADKIKERVLETKSEILPIRYLMNEFITIMANLETMSNKTSQEKFLAVRVKLLELQNKIQKMSKGLYTLQPLLDTMQKFNEENLSTGKKFFVTETLGITQPSSTTISKNSPKKSSNARAPAIPASATARGNTTKKNATPVSMSTPTLKQIPVGQSTQVQSNSMMPGVSPMAMASPVNNISPQRKPNQMSVQTRDNIPYANSMPSNPILTPQNILNMTSLDMNQQQLQNQQQTLRPPENPNSIDLTNLDLDNLNMDFLN